MNKSIDKNNIEQKVLSGREQLTAHSIASIGIALGTVAMKFACIDRVPRYKNGERENDAEHSYMLALVAPEIAATLELPLDRGLVSQFAIVHDLLETKVGDIPTFHFSKEQQVEKARLEKQALVQLVQELPPLTASLLVRYEQQEEPETRFVRLIDKLLPVIVDIIGDGDRVLKEDYNVHTSDLLRQSHDKLRERIADLFGDEFPYVSEAYGLLLELFEQQFATHSPLMVK